MKHSLPIHRVKAWIAGFTSLPKIANSLAILILLLSSTQLGLHVWPQSAFVYGLRVDYLSPTLYLLDLLIIVYCALRFQFLRKRVTGTLVSLIPFLLINLLFSTNPLATITWSLRLFLYLVFILSIQFRSLRDSRQGIGTLRVNVVANMLLIGMLLQAILGGWQIWLGHTLQGPLYWVGERALSVGSPNVAKSELFGEMMLRSYGTFSHPNILAGWLVVACLVVLYVSHNRLLRISTATLASIGVLLAFSRSAAISLFGFIVPFYLVRTVRLRIVYGVVLGVALAIFMNGAASPNLSDLAVVERFKLQEVSLKVIGTYPIFGTGANASITTYPSVAPNFRLLQPDHNSATLFLSWFGWVGLCAMLYFLKTITYQSKAFLPLLPLFLFDHYLLTSPQGVFILILYLRLSLSQPIKPTK